MKKTIEMIKQNTYEKKNKKNTIPEALITTKEKQIIKEEPIQRMEKFGTRSKTRITGNPPCRFCNAPNWSPLHKCPARDSNCNNCGKKGHYARVCKQRIKNNRTVRKLTEEEETEPNESVSESDESRYHIEKIKNIVEQQKHYTAKIKINGTPKEFIIDTGSPVTIMSQDEQIMKTIEIPKLTNRYQDVNKNEVKFWGKTPVDMCCGSNIVNLKQTNIKAAWPSGRIQSRYMTGVGSIPGHAKYFIFWKYFSDFGKNTLEKALLFIS